MVKKHTDQITMNEGKMETDTTSSTTFKKQPVQRNVVEDIVKKQKMRSNITLGDDTTILRTTNQMNFNTVTSRKDERVEKTTDVTDDTNRIRDGTIAITTMKVTTVLENEKDHTPIKEVIRKTGKTNVREEIVHQTSGSDVTNRQNYVNEQHHINEVNQNVVNKRYIVNQHDVNNLQSIESRKTTNQSQITSSDDRNTSRTTTHRTASDTHVSGHPGGPHHKGPHQEPTQVNGKTVIRAVNQHHQTSNIISNQNDQNVVNRSVTKHTTETTDRTGSTIHTTTSGSNVVTTRDGKVVTTRDGSTRHQPIDQYHPSGGPADHRHPTGESQNVIVERHVITQSSPIGRQDHHQHNTFETIENTRNVSDTGSSSKQTTTNQSERTTSSTQRSNQTTTTSQRGGSENVVHEQRTIFTSTPKGRQQNYTSDILNIQDTRSGSKSLASTSQSDKINNQLHLRQHDNTSTNSMSSTSSTTNTRYGRTNSAHNSTSNISNIIHDGQSSACPVHHSSITTTERTQRRDYVQDHGHGPVDQITNNTHHRKNVLTSSTDVNNSVFHRKANLSTNSNEALHSNSMSSTAAIQRKSISNLHDQAIYNTSSDRKSYSSLHRQGKETISHSTSGSTINSQQHGGGSTSQTYSSSHAVHSSSGGTGASGSNNQLRHSSSTTSTSAERAQKIVKKDNLSSSIGGEFYGKSESKAYGSFTTGHQHHVLDRSAVARRSNQSSISFGDGSNQGSSVYRREYAVVHSGPCPAANLDKSSFTHTRDTKSHKFYKSSLHHQ